MNWQIRKLDGLDWAKSIGIGIAVAALTAAFMAAALKTGVSPLPEPLGLAFAETARGRNVPATGMSTLLESALHLVRNDRDAARKCLEKAKSFPRTPDLDRGIEQTERLLDAAPR